MIPYDEWNARLTPPFLNIEVFPWELMAVGYTIRSANGRLP